MNIIPAVAVTVIVKDKVLVVRHGETAGHITGSYGLPAGRLDEDESTRHAAVRELFEETGLVALEADLEEYPNNHYTADLLRKNGETIRSTMTVFICAKYMGSLTGSDETEPEWIALADMHKYEFLPNVEQAVKDSVSYLEGESR